MPLQLSDRTTNLLGALALGVTDRMRSAIAETISLGGEAVGAIVVIGHAPAMSIDQLSRILQMSHAGAVRLVDRLVERGLVEKSPSAADRRVICLALTPSGLLQREEILAHRRAALGSLLAHVAPEDLAALDRIAASIVASLPRDALSALTTCRHCDDRSCVDCPMEIFGPLLIPGSQPASS